MVKLPASICKHRELFPYRALLASTITWTGAWQQYTSHMAIVHPRQIIA